MSQAAKAQQEQSRLQQEADQLLDRQKQMLVRESQALSELDVLEPPPQASSSVMISLDDAQLKSLFELEHGSLSDFQGNWVS